jgi:hypothetical protein
MAAVAQVTDGALWAHDTRRILGCLAVGCAIAVAVLGLRGPTGTARAGAAGDGTPAAASSTEVAPSRALGAGLP